MVLKSTKRVKKMFFDNCNALTMNKDLWNPIVINGHVHREPSVCCSLAEPDKERAAALVTDYDAND